MDNKIIRNAAQCRKCKDIIESKDTNDLKRCSCGSIGVDGGLEYIKRIGNLDEVIELSEFKNDLHLEFKKIRNDSIVKIPMMHMQNMTENIINRSLKPITELKNNLNVVVTSNITSQIQNFSKTLTSSMYSSYLDSYRRKFETMKLEVINNSITNLTKQLNPIQEIAKKLSEILKPITSQIVDNLPKMSSYFDNLSKTLEKAKENPNSVLNWMEYSEKLSEYMWTIPYDISSKELRKLTSIVNSEKEFDKYMLKYFDKIKIEKLFEEILFRIPQKHKTIFKQIKESFYLKNYALVNTGLLSIIDELCSQFLLDKGCSKRKNLLLPIVEKVDDLSDDIFEVIPILVLNDNINVIYEHIDFNRRIKIKTNKKVRRNPSQHGRYFSNRKIDTIMLLNTIYYLLIVMETYRQYVGKIIYVKNSTELSLADAKYGSDIKRFYVRKKYARKKK